MDQESVADVSLTPYTYSASFKADSGAGVGVTIPNVDLSNNQVAFSTYHKFNNGEEVFTEHLIKVLLVAFLLILDIS